MILSICIPSFNRLDCLDNCLNSILISSKNVKDFKFEVCISDNCLRNPTDIINKYTKYIKIVFSRNQQNIGFALNAIKTLELARKIFLVDW